MYNFSMRETCAETGQDIQTTKKAIRTGVSRMYHSESQQPLLKRWRLSCVKGTISVIERFTIHVVVPQVINLYGTAIQNTRVNQLPK